jgi:hypothetical protein
MRVVSSLRMERDHKVKASLSYAYKVGRSYPAGMFLGHTKSVKDLYFAPTRSALPSSSILKIQRYLH